ncbi:MAG: gliding motility protein GldD [Bacteroidales bacterium]
MHSKSIRISLLFVLPLIGFMACDQHYSPKPRGYFRIELQARNYVESDSALPYLFEYPSYANITSDPQSPGEQYWINVNYPQFNATLHLSYRYVSNNLFTYLEDAYTLVSKHIPKADAITDSVIYDPSRQVYGLTYRIEGSGAASPYQFFVTDSTSHFLRGALYFNTTPNNDSLDPVIRFLVGDIKHLINTVHWNNRVIDKP